MKSFNRSAISVFGTDEFLMWVKEVRPELHQWNLDSLNYHPNVYMVEIEDQNCWGDCFDKYYEEIFNNEVGEYVDPGEKWPKNNLKLFRLWFTFEYHESVFDLCNENLKVFNEGE